MPASLAKTMDTYLGRCMRLMTSMGKTASGLALGMFGEIHPGRLRILTLQYRFALRVRRLTGDFAAHYGLEAHNSKTTRTSCFRYISENPFVIKSDLEEHTAATENRDPSPPRTHDLQDEELDSILATRSSTFIFRGKNRQKRKAWRKTFSRMDNESQRLVANWVLNRNAGPWITCHHCRNHAATKRHLEACRWNRTNTSLTGPSWIEEELSRVENDLTLNAVVAALREMVGSRPHEPP